MTPYSAAAAEALRREQPQVVAELKRAELKAMRQGKFAANNVAKDYLRHGVAHQLHLIQRTLSNVFELLPVAGEPAADRERLDDALMNQHAFVVNIHALFDTLSWVFVSHHDLLAEIGDRAKVGFFSPVTMLFFPRALRTFADGAELREWHGRHLTSIRDALAARITPYIRPATYSDGVGSQPAPVEPQWPVGPASGHAAGALDEAMRYPHPQMLSDAKIVADACEVFFKNWRERS